MTASISGRPDPSEFAPYAQAYVDLVDGADIEKALPAQLHSTVRSLEAISDASAGTYSYAPGKWTVKEILGHIIDTERIFAYRVLCLARGDATALPGFEQEDYVKTSGANGRPLPDLVSELQSVRQSTISLLAALPEDAWTRRGTVNGYSVTVRGLAFHMAGHELHHLRIVNDKYRGSRG
jgi:uncharacterized damage-inducible protein DinB